MNVSAYAPPTVRTLVLGGEDRGIRRLVPPTVKDLRPHSSEIKKGDQVQNLGWLVTVIPATIATAKELLAPVAVPQFTSLPEQISWWSTVLEGINALGRLVGSHPWLAGSVFGGVVLVLIGRRLKAARLEKHAAGVPISAEVAKLEAV